MSESDLDKEDHHTLDDVHESATEGEIDLEETMVDAADAGKSKGVDPAHLSKIWKINLKTAECTLKVASQNNKSGPMTLNCPETLVQMTGCSDASGSVSVSSWMHSLPPRRLANYHDDTTVADCL
jgi:hypothetical protein